MKNYTICNRISRKDGVIILIALAVLLISLVFLMGKGRGFGKSEIINVSDLDGRTKYLRSLGWEIDPDSEEKQDILLPAQFTESMSDYIAMQDEQGYDFSSFCGIECKKYTYIVTNYPEYSGTVYAVLYVYGCRVIGGDIHSAELNGFMHGIK